MISLPERMSDDEIRMAEALALASQAAVAGEVPVGAIVVLNGQIVGRGYNRPISMRDPTAHAEIMAMRQAAEYMNNYRLPGAELYVTLEPCVMCAGAIMNARIARVVYGARDPKTGAAGSAVDLFGDDKLNHHASVVGGVCEEAAIELLRAFFASRRKKASDV